jgi:hypothetical protein
MSTLDGLPRTAQEARAAGAKHYFTGKPCVNGHTAPRYVAGACLECQRGSVSRYRAQNPERNACARRARKTYHKTYSAQWYEKNKVFIQSRNRAWRQMNAERNAQNNAAWKKRNPDAVAASRAKRRFAEKKAIPLWADFAKINAVYAEAKRLRGLGQDVHVDHIVPLISDVVCGLHTHDNLRVVPARENLKKGNTHVSA